jgi:hypothetical protein
MNYKSTENGDPCAHTDREEGREGSRRKNRKKGGREGHKYLPQMVYELPEENSYTVNLLLVYVSWHQQLYN